MRPWNTYMMREPDWGSIRTKGRSSLPTFLAPPPTRMEKSGLESQVDPGAAGVAACCGFAVRYDTQGAWMSLEAGKF